MNHFLARLVDRTRGTAPQVEPLIAPRFAPTPVTEFATGVETLPPKHSREAQNTSQNEAPAQKIVRQEIEPRRAKESRSNEPAAAAEAEELLVRREIPVSPPPASIVRRIGPDDVVVSPRTKGKEPKQSLPERATPRPGSATPTTAHAAENVLAGIGDPARPSATRVTFPARRQPNELQAEPPIVRVTIGRIEVRAETPPPPARKSPPRSKPTLSLDAYLKERKEGRR